jgi:predicted lipoprotein with Yx(FWY)xxD motif
MRITTIFAAAALLSLTMGGAVYAADAMPAGVKVKEVKVGDKGVNVLSDSKGMTLYTFDNDVGGKSVCTGQCAQFWPPLMAAADAKTMGQWSVVTRDDGSKQWAFKGKPLYTFVKDTAAADFNGNDQPKDKPVWHCALPG